MTSSAVVSNSTQAVDYNATKVVDASTVFPEVYQPGEAKVRMRVNRHPDCIAADQHYLPSEVVLRRLLAWWHAPFHPQAFGLVGETGTGKTEMLLYVADRLNEPVYLVKCHSGLMPEDIEGSRVLVDGKTPFQPGPAVKAYSKGGLLIFDELDKVNPLTGAALHGLLESKPWPVEQIGATLVKHQQCRIAATGNTMGEGGSVSYTSSNRLDDALRSRIGWYKTKYLEPYYELKILEKKFPSINLSTRHAMVRLGNELRKLRLDDEGNLLENPVGCIFSTRTLCNWGFYLMAFGKNATARESFDFAAQGGIDPEAQTIVAEVIQRIFGDEVFDMTREAFFEEMEKK